MILTARCGLQRTGVEQGVQVGACNQPHGDVEPSVYFADVVDRDDVAVIQAGGGTDLAAEPLLEFGIVGQVREQHLQRHHAVDLAVVGTPDLAHAAAAQQLDQLVTTEWGAFHRLTITSVAGFVA